jgi:hypothetical protein
MWWEKIMQKMKEKNLTKYGGNETCRRWRKSSVAHMQKNLAMLGLEFWI